MADKGWSREFDEPIESPDGTQLKTLRDAISYLVKAIPKAEPDTPEVLTAADMLINAAERESAWVFLARIATLRAIHRNDVRHTRDKRSMNRIGRRTIFAMLLIVALVRPPPSDAQRSSRSTAF